MAAAASGKGAKPARTATGPVTLAEVVKGDVPMTGSFEFQQLLSTALEFVPYTPKSVAAVTQTSKHWMIAALYSDPFSGIFFCSGCGNCLVGVPKLNRSAEGDGLSLTFQPGPKAS